MLYKHYNSALYTDVFWLCLGAKSQNIAVKGHSLYFSFQPCFWTSCFFVLFEQSFETTWGCLSATLLDHYASLDTHDGELWGSLIVGNFY